MFLEHVNFSVPDVDKAAKFYQQLLGFQIRWKGTIGEGRPVIHVGDKRCYIAFFQSDNPGPSPHNCYQDVGINHLGFVVDNLDAMKSRLQELNITPIPEKPYSPGRRVHFFDPDGIEVELVEYDELELEMSA